MRKFPNFTVIKRFYDRGNWTIDMVKVAVEKDFLTADEFKQITGQDYVNDQPQQEPQQLNKADSKEATK